MPLATTERRESDDDGPAFGVRYSSDDPNDAPSSTERVGECVAGPKTHGHVPLDREVSRGDLGGNCRFGVKGLVFRDAEDF